MKKTKDYIYQFTSLLFISLVIYYGGVFLKMWEPVDVLRPVNELSAQKEWVTGRRKIYEYAADKVNRGITGISASHSIDWGILAAIDFVLVSESKFKKEYFTREFDVFEEAGYPDFNVMKLAESLRSNVKEDITFIVTETVYTLKYNDETDGKPAVIDMEDIINPDYYETEITEEKVINPVIVDTFRGRYIYEYDIAENSYVTDYDDEGNAVRVVSVRGPVITGVDYREDWSRLKHAVIDYAGIGDDLESFGIKPGDYVTSDDVEKILKIAEELSFSFDFSKIPGYYGHVWPVLEDGRKVTSSFGWRPNPFGRGYKEFHTGIDIAPLVKGRPGDILVAAASGEISVHGGYGSARGYYTELECKDGLLYRYFHLDGRKPFHSNALSGKVRAGDVIGFMGTTGSSTNVHLHFDVSYAGDVPDILKKVTWIDDEDDEMFNRRFIYERNYIDPCILLKLVAPDIENSCLNRE